MENREPGQRQNGAGVAGGSVTTFISLGDLSVVPTGATEPRRESVLGAIRSEVLERFLTGKTTPGYEVWYAGQKMLFEETISVEHCWGKEKR